MHVKPTGYGHVRLTVTDLARGDRFDEAGIAHGCVKDIGVASILEFRDPDGIALELVAAH